MSTNRECPDQTRHTHAHMDLCCLHMTYGPFSHVEHHMIQLSEPHNEKICLWNICEQLDQLKLHNLIKALLMHRYMQYYYTAINIKWIRLWEKIHHKLSDGTPQKAVVAATTTRWRPRCQWGKTPTNPPWTRWGPAGQGRRHKLAND